MTNTYDALGSLVAASGATYPVAHGYDTAGRMMALSTTRDGNAWDTTQWIYDPATGRATAKTYADDSSIAYTYTADGRPTRTTWARGAWRQHAYNAEGLLAATTYSDATPAVSLTYDAFFRLTAASNAVAAYAYVNSALGTATNEIAMVGGEVFTLTRGLDNRQRLASLNVGAAQVHYAYDAENRLATVSNDVFTVTYAYTPVGLDAGYAVTLTNGVVLARALTRDLYRRGLVRTITNRVDGVAVNPLAYDYDVLNRVTTRNADALSYNARSEVISAMIEPGHTNRYEFDGIGNALWTSLNTATNSYTANALNQYTAISNLVQSCNPVHDLDGNMLTNGAWSYTWDAENRLTGVASNGIHVVTNAYDYMNRRVTKTTAVKVTHFIWDGWNIVAEIAVDRQTGETNLTRYVWGLDLSGTLQGAGGVGGLLAVSLNGTWHFPLFDNNGNITAYVNEQSTVVAEYTYDAFGRTIVQSGPMADAFHHRFSTKYFDAETGLVMYQIRPYSPPLGRWLSRDPIGENGGILLYGFVNNGPISRYDSLGLLFGIDIPGVTWDDYNQVIQFVNVIIDDLGDMAGFPTPKAPINNNEQADWSKMMLDWFLENGPNPITFDSGSAHSKDIANSTSMAEVLAKWCQNKQTPTGWGFTGMGTDQGDFGGVEWFLGSYSIQGFSLSGAQARFEVHNVSGWYSGTRLPQSWQDWMQDEVGFSIDALVTDAERGEVLKTKLLNRFPWVGQIPFSGRLLNRLPSFGGNWAQIYKVEMEWCCP